MNQVGLFFSFGVISSFYQKHCLYIPQSLFSLSFSLTHRAICNSSQCSMTGVTKDVVCVILSLG